ncbi:hypothetical protein LTR15_011725 [Elasticomyces elasticus]|nr:hypothetical protein LTR15_011725 [Elasticomyces elasticus]
MPGSRGSRRSSSEGSLYRLTPPPGSSSAYGARGYSGAGGSYPTGTERLHGLADAAASRPSVPDPGTQRLHAFADIALGSGLFMPASSSHGLNALAEAAALARPATVGPRRLPERDRADLYSSIGMQQQLDEAERARRAREDLRLHRAPEPPRARTERHRETDRLRNADPEIRARISENQRIRRAREAQQRRDNAR